MALILQTVEKPGIPFTRDDPGRDTYDEAYELLERTTGRKPKIIKITEKDGYEQHSFSAHGVRGVEPLIVITEFQRSAYFPPSRCLLNVKSPKKRKKENTRRGTWGCPSRT